MRPSPETDAAFIAAFYRDEAGEPNTDVSKIAIFARRLEGQRDELMEALEAFVEMYVAMVNSGDCGNWNPETEKEVIAARAAIRKVRGEGKA